MNSCRKHYLQEQRFAWRSHTLVVIPYYCCCHCRASLQLSRYAGLAQGTDLARGDALRLEAADGVDRVDVQGEGRAGFLAGVVDVACMGIHIADQHSMQVSHSSSSYEAHADLDFANITWNCITDAYTGTTEHAGQILGHGQQSVLWQVAQQAMGPHCSMRPSAPKLTSVRL